MDRNIALLEKHPNYFHVCHKVLTSIQEENIYSFHRNKDKQNGMMTAPNDIS